jgi:choline dehydrogenase
VDFGEVAHHGSSGPVTLRRPAPNAIHPLDRAFTDACVHIGIPYEADINNGEYPAVGPVPSNVGYGAERQDIYRCYLAPAETRTNLTVVTDALTEEIEFKDQTAVAINVARGDRKLRLTARRIVLCAGAIGSTALLQRSGIGEARLLRQLGIPVVHDAPAVGRNLMDHSSLVVWAKPKAGVCAPNLPWRQVVARTCSGVDDQMDVQLGLLNNVDSTTVPSFQDRVDYPMLVGGSVMLMRPSTRGRVYITSRDSKTLPHIDLPLSLSDEDTERMMGGVRKIWRLMMAPGVHSYLDGVQFWTDAMIDNDTVVRSAVRNLVNPGWHASGTLRMGAADDPNSVTGEDGRLHGLRGLWVADASLFPAIPSMPTNLTTVMTAERIAHFIDAETRL